MEDDDGAKENIGSEQTATFLTLPCLSVQKEEAASGWVFWSITSSEIVQHGVTDVAIRAVRGDR